MDGRDSARPADLGLTPEHWRRSLDEALAAGDPAGLRQALVALRAEIRSQSEELARRERAPGLDRLVEQARRLLATEPTEGERLEAELADERALWARFRERYRDTFVPADLQPFLDCCAAFLDRSSEGVQFDGFDKYAGRVDGATRLAVTLFRRSGEPAEGETPANFFARYEPRAGRLVVERCYRTSLPRGAGELVLDEQLRALVSEPAGLRALVFDNVQNRATYDAHVCRSGGDAALRDGVPWDASPLGRLGGRLLGRSGVTIDRAEPSLDGFGFLDLVLVVAPPR